MTFSVPSKGFQTHNSCDKDSGELFNRLKNATTPAILVLVLIIISNNVDKTFL